MKRLPVEEELAAMRVLELMLPLTLFIVEEVPGDARDRLAMRVALELMLERVTHPDDDAAAKRIGEVIKEGIRLEP